MKATAVYLRVSTVGQNEEGQRQAVQRWLDNHACRNVRWYLDRQTGDNLDRPEFERLQAEIRRGEVSAVVCFKLDRLSRRMIDGLNVLTDWLTRGVRVVSVTQDLDFSGTVGKLIASTLFAVAEMEQETRRERQAEGIKVAKSRGVYRGRKPGSTKAKPQRARQLRDKGLSVAEIATALGVGYSTACRYLAS
jgi:DNA invertase Pin-like site-specific DNA recombinase